MLSPRSALSRAAAVTASVIWAVAGISKILTFAQGRVGSLLVAPEVMAIVGLAELTLAVGWWIPPLKRPFGLVGVALGVVFGMMIVLGLLHSESCGCFGSLRVSRARHLLVVGVLVISGSLGLIHHDDARRTVAT